MKLSRNTQSFVSKTIIIVLLLFFTFQALNRIFTSPFEFDESVNLILARNLFQNGIYSTYERVFDPVITTGPTVLIPASLSLVFNNQYFPRLIPLIYTYLLLFFVLEKILRNIWLKIVFLLMFIVTPYSSYFASHVLGEIPAIYFSLAALYFLNRKNYFWGGLSFGLAIFTKNIFILTAIPCLYYFYCFRKEIGKKEIMRFFVPLIALFVIWEIYRFVTVGFSINSYFDSLLQFARYQKGLSKSNPSLFFDRIDLFGFIFGFNGFLIYFSIILLLASTFLGQDRFIKSISIFTFFYLQYFVILGYESWYRHLFPVIVFFLIILASKVEEIDIGKLKYAFILFLFFSLTISKIDYRKFLLQQNLLPMFDSTGNKPFEKSYILTQQLNTKEYIETRIPNEKISGILWFNSPDISYLTNRQIYRVPYDNEYHFLISQFFTQGTAPDIDKIISGYPSSKLVFDSGLFQIYEKMY